MDNPHPFDAWLAETILSITQEKEFRGKEPTHAMKTEIMERMQKELTASLTRLYKAQEISYFRTINEYGVKIVSAPKMGGSAPKTTEDEDF